MEAVGVVLGCTTVRDGWRNFQAYSSAPDQVTCMEDPGLLLKARGTH